jgi:glycosyltransferase involved in cell wall biosynthesis
VLVLPTRVNGLAREAAGLVLLEAQACGTPVIAYDSGGTGEMLRDGDTGWLAVEGDISALTSRVGDVLALSDLERAAVGERARRFVVAERSLARSAEELAAIYEEFGA